MPDLAALKATYTEWKMVKTRKVLVLSFEVPLEMQAKVQETLGTPMPDESIWVGIARITGAATEGRGGKLAQQAGILCSQGAFDQLARETGHTDGKAMIYSLCGVTSRRDLDHDDAAAAKFRDLKADYEMWLKDIAA